MSTYERFVKRFSRSSQSQPESKEKIIEVEKTLEILFPDEYRQFAQQYGSIWTPDILEIIIDKNVELNDVQEFWNSEKIIYDKQKEWTSKVSGDFIPFASDSMNNIFAFKRSDLKIQKLTAEIYFIDHDFETVEKISDSFSKWIESYNHL